MQSWNTSPILGRKRSADELLSMQTENVTEETTKTTSLSEEAAPQQLSTSTRLSTYDEDIALVIIDDSQLDVATILAKYVTGKVKGREHLLKLTGVTDEARGKRRVIKVMQYLLDIASPDENRILELTEPPRHSEQWTKWNSDLKQVKLVH